MHRRTKTSLDIITYRMNFARALEAIWQPGHAYDVGDYVRPMWPNGFEYECTNAGQTAQDAPDWPVVIASTIDDGSVQWTARDYGINASDTITSKAVTADTGITIDSSSLEGTEVIATLSGGTPGKVYDVQFKAINASGDAYVETLRVTVAD